MEMGVGGEGEKNKIKQKKRALPQETLMCHRWGGSLNHPKKAKSKNKATWGNESLWRQDNRCRKQHKEHPQELETIKIAEYYEKCEEKSWWKNKIIWKNDRQMWKRTKRTSRNKKLSHWNSFIDEFD